MGFEFKIAETESEKEEIYRFRYRIYIEEMNRPTHADHENRMITDWMDEKGILFYAVKDNEMIATARTNFAKYGRIEFEEEYEIDRFKPYFPQNVSTSTKLMVVPEFRRSSLTARFTTFLYVFNRENDICFDFININKPLHDFYKRLGYRKYKRNFIHPEFGEVIPMVIVLNDYNYLKNIKSPFTRAKFTRAKVNGYAFNGDIDHFYKKIYWRKSLNDKGHNPVLERTAGYYRRKHQILRNRRKP